MTVIINPHRFGIGGNDSFTTVLLHMDGSDASTTFTDSNVGGSAHTWTVNGNAQVDTAESKFGGASGLFDGSGDYLSHASHADWAMASGDFTIDAWCRRAGGNGSFRGICGDLWFGTYSFQVRLDTNNVVQAVAHLNGTDEVVTGTTAFTGTDWFHVAFVRTGNTLKLFVNGVQEGGDNACSGTMTDGTGGGFAIGRLGAAEGGVWNGWIDEFRISKGIARWTANFTPPTSAYEP
jgi:hypothetical protein